MRYWWVNQNQTYKHEVAGGFVWSPKANRDGRRNEFYDNMTKVAAGDLIFSFADTFIPAIGRATGPAQSSQKPDFGSVGNQWSDDGWLVPVEYSTLLKPIRPKDFIDELRPHLASKYSPLQPNGNGNQGVYLAEVSGTFADVLLRKAGVDIDVDDPIDSDAAEEQASDHAQSAIEGRTDIGPTQKLQLVLSRRGQGVFKANVRLNGKTCRCTGVSHPSLLVASHIKPWSKSSDKEKLDGYNGIMLSPHVDRLFDRGFISFEDDGGLKISSKLAAGTLEQWGLQSSMNVGPFSPKQSIYLEYHRDHVFKG
ncbi:MAG: HNH endonuclease [Sphingomicrobium sp.]